MFNYFESSGTGLPLTPFSPSERQKVRDETIARLAAHQEKQKINEEDLIAKAIEEKDAREARELREKEEKRQAMLQSISAHREATVKPRS